MNSDTNISEALGLAKDILFEPGCFFPKDPFHEARLRGIINERVKTLGHPLLNNELVTLVNDLAAGRIPGIDGSGPEYSARLAIRIAQRTLA